MVYTLDDLLGDLEVHYCGYNPNYGVLCDCDQIDPTIRMHPAAQLDAILRLEIYREAAYNDPASDWIEYLERIGWTNSKIRNWARMYDITEQTDTGY